MRDKDNSRKSKILKNTKKNSSSTTFQKENIFAKIRQTLLKD